MCYIKPQSGTITLIFYDLPIPSKDFCIDLFNKTGVLLTPGSCFELENCMRIGFAGDSEVLIKGLNKLSEYLKSLAYKKKAVV